MHLADVTSPARGAYADLNDLIALRFPARQLGLARRNRALNALAGPNKSNFRGRGIDFEEVRSYQPGDDIRTIDWRVTARTGSAHTKLFREERERPVLVVVDQRSEMFFGSSHCCKSVLAAQLASLVAWSALDAVQLGIETTVILSACRAIDLEGSLQIQLEAMRSAGVNLAA